MKILIASDIHGSEYRAKQIYDIWKNGNYDKVILLGDLLYHGPRNDLPQFYRPKGVIPLLSEMKETTIAVRGNCDAEVDQMVLPYYFHPKLQIPSPVQDILKIHNMDLLPHLLERLFLSMSFQLGHNMSGTSYSASIYEALLFFVLACCYFHMQVL